MSLGGPLDWSWNGWGSSVEMELAPGEAIHRAYIWYINIYTYICIYAHTHTYANIIFFISSSGAGGLQEQPGQARNLECQRLLHMLPGRPIGLLWLFVTAVRSNLSDTLTPRQAWFQCKCPLDILGSSWIIWPLFNSSRFKPIEPADLTSLEWKVLNGIKMYQVLDFFGINSRDMCHGGDDGSPYGLIASMVSQKSKFSQGTNSLTGHNWRTPIGLNMTELTARSRFSSGVWNAWFTIWGTSDLMSRHCKVLSNRSHHIWSHGLLVGSSLWNGCFPSSDAGCSPNSQTVWRSRSLTVLLGYAAQSPEASWRERIPTSLLLHVWR